MKNLIVTFILVALAICLGLSEEGMYPMSEIHKLSLEKKGLQISAKDIYNPDDISIVDAICIVGSGCTGSFVSDVIIALSMSDLALYSFIFVYKFVPGD